MSKRQLLNNLSGHFCDTGFNIPDIMICWWASFIFGQSQPCARALNWPRQGLPLLSLFDIAKSSIIGPLQATCIMPNSLCSSFSCLLIHVIQSSSLQQGSLAPLCLGRQFVPWVTPHFSRTKVRIRGTGMREQKRDGQRTHVTLSEWSILWLSL